MPSTYSDPINYSNFLLNDYEKVESCFDQDNNKLNCVICGNQGKPKEIGSARSNVRSIRNQIFSLWRCAKCESLHCEIVSNYSDLYQEYPLRNQRLDYFLNAWYGVILKRLISVGLHPDNSILDYGCGTGLFLDFLKQKGYHNCFGYDPHVKLFNQTEVLANRYDFVISLDVVEHDLDPVAFIKRLINLLNPSGQLCLETPNAEGIELKKAEDHIHALHLPYHVHLVTPDALENICHSAGLQTKVVFKNWYMNTWWPGTSRRFFEAYMHLGKNDIDDAFDPLTWKKIAWSIPLVFHFLFGGLIPETKHDHMMAIFHKSYGKG